MLRRSSLLFLAAFTASAVHLQGQQPSPQSSTSLREALQRKFEELHKAATFPGGTAGFVLADGSSIDISVGVSDRTAGTPMKPTDRLLLGSARDDHRAGGEGQLLRRAAEADPRPLRAA